MKVTITDNSRGLLFRKGRFVKVLPPGQYRTWFGATIETLALQDPIRSKWAPLDTLMNDAQIKAYSMLVEVPDGRISLHYVNGLFVAPLIPGRYLFWTIFDRHEFREVDMTKPEVPTDIPPYVMAKLPPSLYVKIVVANHEKGRLYFNGKFMKLLEPGTYYYWQGATVVSFDLVKSWQQQMDINGQEILTKDKVTLRMNLVVVYRIRDFIKITTEIDNYVEQMRVVAQLAIREFVSKSPLDEILESKEALSAHLLNALKQRENDFYVEIMSADVKDIILPGEIRDIMNTVLVAEKRAQANVITRREEVASTRSLLNTAKLLDENQTLYKLKELEYVERIFQHVGSISLNGTGDLLSQLLAAIRNPK